MAPPTGNSMSALKSGEAVRAKLGMWLALRIEVHQENWSPARTPECFRGTGVERPAHLDFSGLESIV